MAAPNGHDLATAEHIARQLGLAKRDGADWTCKCPTHDDHNPSLVLSVAEDGKLLWHCRAKKCSQQQVGDELKRRGLLPKKERPPQRGGKAGRTLDATYSYPDEAGGLLFQALRYRNPDGVKKFSQRRPDGAGGWIWNLDGVRRVPYRLPHVKDEPHVLLVEGEKCADRLAALGYPATTTAGGAGGWRKADLAPLAGKRVTILPDLDAGGAEYRDGMGGALRALGCAVHLLELPGLTEEGDDVVDWLDRGGTTETLTELVNAAPDWQPRARTSRAREKPAPRTDWTAELRRRGKNDECERNDFNILLALRQAPELQGRFRLNLLAGTIEAGDMPWRQGSEWLAWGDPDNHRLAAWLQARGIDVRPTQVAGNVGTVADEARHDPVKDYLLALKWDGAERLSSWLVTHLGAHDAPSEYLKGVARAWAIAMVARALKPGCKADHILILEGPQGRLKSSALKALMPDEAWFSDEIATLGTKDSAQDLRGKWLIELSELSAMQRAEVERTKAALSRCTDHYRPSFGHYSQDFPRRNGFAGSTNHDAYLLDDTGNRRIWGVKVGTILLDALERDRDQLWAEAVHAYQAGEQWWLEPAVENHAAAEQAKRLEEDSWTHDVVTWGLIQVEPFSANDALLKALHLVDASKRDDKATKRVVRILRTNGFTPHRTSTARLWTKPSDTVPEPSPATVTQNPLYNNAPDGMTVVTPDVDAHTRAHTRVRDVCARTPPGEPSKSGVTTVTTDIPLRHNGNFVSVQGDTGIEPSPPAWAADWPTWDGRCGADPAAIRDWIALAGGTSERRSVTLPASCRLHPAALKRLLSHITLQAWKVDWT
jgi:predicted P-loop ATPase